MDNLREDIVVHFKSGDVTRYSNIEGVFVHEWCLRIQLNENEAIGINAALISHWEQGLNERLRVVNVEA